jgi:predicted cobalt transporter CbtA
MDAAELGARQAWWIATVLATATALLIFAFRQQIYWMLAGLALLIAPHIYGAPHLATHESVVPANLAAEFVVATIVTSFLFWLVLGGTLGWLGQRINDGYLDE